MMHIRGYLMLEQGNVIASNTVPSPASKVDISDLAGKNITSILATHIAKSI